MPPAADLALVLPHLILLGGGLLLLLPGIGSVRSASAAAALLAALAAAAALILPAGRLHQAGGGPAPFLPRPDHFVPVFGGLFVVDGLSLVIQGILLTATLLAALLAIPETVGAARPGLLFGSLLIAAAGGLLVTGAADLTTVFLGVELLAAGSYLLAAWPTGGRPRSEAAVKAFFYGAAGSAVLLYGISLVFGLAGTTALYSLPAEDGQRFLPTLGAALERPGGPGVALVAFALVAAGLGSKVAAVPFHLWAPDVWEGTALPAGAWLSTAGIAACLTVLARLLLAELPPAVWVTPVAALAAATILVAGLSALPQRGLRRLLTCSGVAQTGFGLMGIAVLGGAGGVPGEASAPGSWPSLALPLHLAGASLAGLGAFAAAGAARGAGIDRLEALAGLARRSPALAWALLLFGLSLAGLPPAGGFLGRLALFAAAFQDSEVGWLAPVAAAGTLLLACALAGIVRGMFLGRAEAEPRVRAGWPYCLVLGAAAAGTIGLCLGAGPVTAWLGALR